MEIQFFNVFHLRSLSCAARRASPAYKPAASVILLPSIFLKLYQPKCFWSKGSYPGLRARGSARSGVAGSEQSKMQSCYVCMCPNRSQVPPFPDARLPKLRLPGLCQQNEASCLHPPFPFPRHHKGSSCPLQSQDEIGQSLFKGKPGSRSFHRAAHKAGGDRGGEELAGAGAGQQQKLWLLSSCSAAPDG